jgi:tetratricopeptide (TPR) repeat protein
MSVAVCLVILTAVTVLAIRFAKSHPYLIVGWLWYLGTLAPVIGFVQAGDQGRADRFTYVPLIGLFIAVVFLIRDVTLRLRFPVAVRYGAIAILSLGLAILTRAQLKYWQNDLTLWERTVAVTSNNYRAENLYGVALTDAGRLEDGIRHYEAALRAWPESPEAHNNLGAARMEQGRYQDAVREFEAAARARPASVQFKYNLAAALDAAGRREDAVQQIRAGLAIEPDNPSLLEAARLFEMNLRK